MAIAFVAASAVVTGASPTVAIPAGYAEGNLLIIVAVGASGTPATPTGWTQRYAQGTGRFLTILTKYAASSEASVSLTGMGSGATSVMVCYSGVANYDALSTIATGTSTTATTGTQTTTYDNDYVISTFARATGASTFTTPTGTTSRVNSAATAGSSGLLIADELQASAGTTTARSTTLSASGAWAAISISFTPIRTLYWVGGTGTWDTTTTTNWSLTSGGASGAIAPTSADNVIIDSNSGTGTITCTLGVCNDLTVTATQAIILGAASSTFSVYGNLTFPSGGSFSASTNTNVITFAGTTTGLTITTNGKSLSQINFSGVGGVWTLGSALTTRFGIQLTNGTFDTSSTNNYALTVGDVGSISGISLGVGTKALNLNDSTVTLPGSNPISFTADATGFTFNAGTSNINCTNASSTNTFDSGGFTFYNVTFVNVPALTISLSSATVTTFNNLTFPSGSSNGIYAISLAANQTINGTLTLGASNTAVRRVFLRSSAIGTSRTITATTVATLADVDFRDITFSSSQTGTRLGDCGGNTNITFPATKTVYWNLTGTQTWDATAWATSSGGTPALNNFPLAQDTAVFDNSGAATTVSIGTTWNLGAIDMSTRTTGFTFTYDVASIVYGSITLFSNLTYSQSATMTISGRGTQIITSAGNSFAGITVNTVTGTVQLGDALNNTSTLTLTSGTFNGNSFNVTVLTFSGTGTSTRTLTLGNGLWTLTGTGTVWTTATTTGLTFSKGTSDILLSDTSTTARTFNGGGLTYNKLTIGGTTGTSTTTISGTNTVFGELASTKTIAHTISFGSTLITITTWSVTGTAGDLVSVISSISGTQRSVTITNKTSGIDYLNVKDINAVNIAPYTFFVGANSTNSGNNTGVAFVSPNNNAYLLTSGSTFTIPANWSSSSNSIYVIGGGGGGSGNSIGTVTVSRIGGSGGGGGGYYALTNQSYTAGDSITYTIGTGGAGSNGAAGGSATSTGGTGLSSSWDTNETTVDFVASSSQQNTGSSTTITINVPSGTANGDVMIVFLTSASGSGNWTQPATWQLGATATGRAVFFRTASSEPASYTFTGPSSAVHQGFMLTYRNCAVGVLGAASSLATPTVANGVTTTYANSFVLAWYSTTTTATTFTTPTNFTSVISDSDATAPSSAIFSRTFASIGSTGSVSSTPSGGVTAIGRLITLTPLSQYSYVAKGGSGGVSTGGNSSTGGAGGYAATAPTFFASATNSTPTTTPIVLNKPTGTATGDLMIMFLQANNTTSSFTPPAGWTVITNASQGAGVYYKVALAGEASNYSVSFTTASATSVGTIATFQNATYDAAGSAWVNSSTDPTAIALTTDTSGGILLWLARGTTGTTTFIMPAGYTQIDQIGASGGSLGYGYRTGAAKGTTEIVTGTSSASARAMLISIEPTTLGTGIGGTGGTSAASTTTGACGGGGGGGAAGPNGNGGNGGNGNTGATATVISAGGGGGNGGGSAGGNASSSTSGAGGNNSLGTGGGASTSGTTGTAGTIGGGGSGGATTGAGGSGGGGIDIQNTVGGGGGSGGASGGINNNAPVPGSYGGGAGGAGCATSTATYTGDAGIQGMIFILYSSGTSYTDSITENSSLADVLSLLAQYSVSTSENVDVNDVATVVGQYTFSIAEDSNMNDVISISLQFSFNITEDVILNDNQTIGSSYTFTLTDGISIEDFNSAFVVFVKTISEDITLADLNTTVSDFLASFTDNITVQDITAAQLATSLSAVENVNLDNIQSIGLAFVASIAEATTIDDIRIIGLAFADSITENIIMGDTAAGGLQLLFSIIENTNITDVESIKGNFVVSMLENFNLLDLYCQTGWLKVNNTEDNTWTIINNTEDNTWTLITNDENNAWSPINTTQC